MDNGIRISFTLKYEDIEEVRQSEDRKTTTIILRSGNKYTFSNGHGKRIFKKLSRTRSGEQLE